MKTFLITRTVSGKMFSLDPNKVQTFWREKEGHYQFKMDDGQLLNLVVPDSYMMAFFGMKFEDILDVEPFEKEEAPTSEEEKPDEDIYSGMNPELYT